MPSIIKTESGSIYELDQANKRIRRIEGMQVPTPRMGSDGTWKTFVQADIVDMLDPDSSNVKSNDGCTQQRLAIIWRWDLQDGTMIARSTLTSAIVEVHEIAIQPEG